jgi:hypothetical protein
MFKPSLGAPSQISLYQENSSSVVDLDDEVEFVNEVKSVKKSSLIVCPKKIKKRDEKFQEKKGGEHKGRGSIQKQNRNPYYYFRNAIEKVKIR